eukprot:6470257-Amphidinium_carterae.1
MQLRYEDGRIRVSRESLEQDGFMGACGSLLLACWHCEAFVESRWVSVGASARSYVLAECTGLGNCFRWARNNEHLKEYYSSGYLNMSLESKYFLACAALVSVVPEHFLASILADNRVPMHLMSLMEGLRADADFVQSLPDVVLQRVLNGVGLPQSVLSYRSDVYHAIVTAVAYIQYRVIEPASEYPWRFCFQNMQSSLEELRTSSESLSSDCVTTSLQRVARAGCGDHVLKEALQLLAQCSWTSHLAERLHASAATCHRFNPDLGAEGLAGKAFAHMFAQLCVQDLSLQKRVSKLSRQID